MLSKERLHSDEEITEVLADAWRMTQAAELPEPLQVEAFKIALTLRSQVAVSQGPILQAHGLLQ